MQDPDVYRAYSALKKAKHRSAPKDKLLSQELRKFYLTQMLRAGYEMSDYHLASDEFCKCPGETVTEALNEDGTWLVFYRRMRDKDHA